MVGKSFSLVHYQGDKQDKAISVGIISEASPVSCSGNDQSYTTPGQEDGSFLSEAHRL